MNKNLSDSIKISVNAAYISEQSNPESNDYIFAYTVTIKNIGDEPAQLISRHWFITNSDGETHEVHGEGVVGQKPHILPGEDFRYTSGTRLDTPVGSMHGNIS